MRYNFEWDPKKADQNLRKHGISFERSAYVFKDPHAISIYDDDHSLKEDRWITIGKNGGGILLVVVHTFRKLDDPRVPSGSSPQGKQPGLNLYNTGSYKK